MLLNAKVEFSIFVAGLLLAAVFARILDIYIESDVCKNSNGACTKSLT